MSHHEFSDNQHDKRIADPAVARDVAAAERPYRELEVHAKQLLLGHIAIDMAGRADMAGNAAYVDSTTRQSEGPSSERPPRIYRPHEHASKEEFTVVARSFSEARTRTKKHVTDSFIDNALESMHGRLKIGENRAFSIKSYLDQVIMTTKDIEVARDSSRIAKLYRDTTEMIQRNLKIMISDNVSEARMAEVKDAKDTYKALLHRQVPETESAIVQWCARRNNNQYPVDALEYKGFRLNGQDILDSTTKCSADLEPNFKIQRQLGGAFIMAFSNERVKERKSSVRNEEPNRRIYLNPDLEMTPSIFEQILKMANQENVKLQLKMVQRIPELTKQHANLTDRPNHVETMRGDGIVIYVHDKYEDSVLDKVLRIVEENAEAFRGRGVSRTPVRIADGVAIGDEPIGVHGKESLTSHRATLFEQTLQTVRRSGLKGAAAHRLFRTEFQKLARTKNVNPENFAFNA